VINMATSEAQAAQAVAVVNEVTGRFLDADSMTGAS